MDATSRPASGRGRSNRRRIYVGALLLGTVLCAGWAAVAHGQSLSWHIVQGSDGTLYAVIGGVRFTVEPDPISADELAGLGDGGDVGSYLESSGLVPSPMPTVGSSGVPSPTPTLALVAGTPSPVPATPGAPGPSPTPRLAPAATVAGSRESPIPINTLAPIADNWQLKVLSTQPDGTKDVVAANGGRQPPSGYQYYLAHVQVTNSGDGGRPFGAAARLRAVGTSGTPYLPLASACGNVPNALPAGPVGGGSTLEGNVCWAIQSSDAATLALYDAPLSGADALRTYFALH